MSIILAILFVLMLLTACAAIYFDSHVKDDSKAANIDECAFCLLVILFLLGAVLSIGHLVYVLFR